MTKLAGIFRNMHFLCKTTYSFQKQSMGGALKVLATSLKTVFDEVFNSKFALLNSIQKYEDYLEQ